MISPSKSPSLSSNRKPSESQIDIQLSWKLLRENAKAFLYNDLFAMLGFFLVVVIIFIVEISRGIMQGDGIWFFFENWKTWLVNVVFPIATLGIPWLNLFLSCQFGLAHDIMTSGFMYTEFKKSFTYFWRYWWQYLILNFLISLFSPFSLLSFWTPPASISLPLISLLINIIIFSIIHFMLFMLVIATFPSITHQGSLFKSFFESFRILKKDFKRVIKTWGFFYILFYIPSYILIIPLYFSINTYLGTFLLIVILGAIIGTVMFLYLIGSPLMALISTRIYNSVDFKRFKPLLETSN